MQLSEFSGKNIRSGKYTRGVCVGIGISLKSKAVKFLLCASHAKDENESVYPNSDFAVNINAIEELCGDEIVLSRLRALSSKNCAKLYIGQPVYNEEGVYLGKIKDVYMQNFIATHITTDKNITQSILNLTASSDVILLRKEQPYPIGQLVHAPSIFPFLQNDDVLITKQILRMAAENRALIRLTLSLPPFQMQPLDFPPKKRKWF